MKRILYIAFILLFVTHYSFAQGKGIDLNWQTDLDKATRLAEKEDKLVLLYFTGSDWNKACQLLNKEFFYTKKFQSIASDNLVLVRINSPRRSNLISKYQKDSNEKLSKKYNQKVFPTVILLDTRGKELGRVESYNYLKDTSQHYNLVKKATKKRS